jgi:hypothetical protein
MLVEKLSARGVTTLVFHDFDKSGFEILDKFTSDTRRYAYQSKPTVVDLGLRLAEAQAMGLQSEDVGYGRQDIDPRISLRACGATDDECNFLVSGRDPSTDEWTGERIEINAMTSREILDFLEVRLAQVGATKFVPDEATLKRAYQKMARAALLQAAVHTAWETLPDEDTITVPDGLEDTIRQDITGSNAALPWDDALWALARANTTKKD